MGSLFSSPVNINNNKSTTSQPNTSQVTTNNTQPNTSQVTTNNTQSTTNNTNQKAGKPKTKKHRKGKK